MKKIVTYDVNTEKYCWACENVKKKTEFQANKVKSDGLEGCCRICKQEDYKKRRDKRKALGLCHCGRELISPEKTCRICQKRVANWAANNKEYQIEFRSSKRKDNRKKVFEHYGLTCACCGETRLEFLQLDHIAGGGGKHRKELAGDGKNFHAWIIKKGFPEGYRTLCANCNWSRGQFGYCPHEREKQTVYLDAKIEVQADTRRKDVNNGFTANYIATD